VGTVGKRIQEDGGQKAEDGSQLGLPEGGDGVGDFVLEDFDEFFAFRLTIGSALYKYMRIYLWTAVWQRFCVSSGFKHHFLDAD